MKFSILGTALLCLLINALAWADSYRVVTEEWAPYNYQENGQLTGMATEIVRAIMARTGDNFSIEVVPSMRTTHMLQDNQKTIMYSLFRTPEREALYKWVGPIVEESIYPYQLSTTNKPVHTLADLLNAPRITTRHDGLVPDTLETLGFHNLDKSATQSSQLYRMLQARRTELIIGDTSAGVAYYSRQLGIAPSSLRRVPLELYRASLYIAFSQNSDNAHVAAWNQALQALRRSGEIQRIQQRYEQFGEK